MPQFDFFSFFVQIFWLSIASCLFYLIYLKSPLKNASEAAKMRTKIKTFTSEINKKVNVKFLYNSVILFSQKKI